MSKSCIKCSDKDRTNQHRLIPSEADIVYDSSKTMTDFCLPRKYTSTHNDSPPTLFIGIGKDYNQRLLSTEEVLQSETQIVGKWIKKKGKYQIHLKLNVSTEKNPLAEIRNMIFCSELGVSLESIALAETCMLKANPELASTKIYVHFKSIDPAYNRIEYWNRLGHWMPKCEDSSESESSESESSDCKCSKCDSSKSKKSSHKKHRKRYPRLPPQMCAACVK